MIINNIPIIYFYLNPTIPLLIGSDVVPLVAATPVSASSASVSKRIRNGTSPLKDSNFLKIHTNRHNGNNTHTYLCRLLQ